MLAPVVGSAVTTSPDVEPHARRLRIGIDAEALRNPLSGVGQYVFQLARRLEQELPRAQFYAYGRLPRSRLALPSDAWICRTEAHPALRKLPSFLWLRTRGAQLCRRDEIDVFWAGRTLHPGLGAGVRTVCTVHDLNHLIVPETMQAVTRVSHLLWFERDVRRADAVVANSEGTARRLKELLDRDATVVRPGLDGRFFESAPDLSNDDLSALGIKSPYLLCVATLEPRKNLENAYRAFIALRERGLLRDHRFVVAGPNGWVNSKFERVLNDAVGAGTVVRTGYVPDELLPRLYAHADLVMVPSLYEGFGMPALEARACGARLLVSGIPELEEAAGPWATRVEPTIEGISKGIVQALASTHVPESANELREEFSWSKSALRLASILSA
jgi:glycosyltransferase involved in cell wall biosynthesis